MLFTIRTKRGKKLQRSARTTEESWLREEFPPLTGYTSNFQSTTSIKTVNNSSSKLFKSKQLLIDLLISLTDRFRTLCYLPRNNSQSFQPYQWLMKMARTLNLTAIRQRAIFSCSWRISSTSLLWLLVAMTWKLHSQLLTRDTQVT